MIELDRRSFLKGAAAFAMLPLLGVEVVRTQEQEPLNLPYEQAITDAIHFRRLLDKIPEEKKVGIKNGRDLANWTREIVPYFEYEGIVEDKKPGEYMGLVYPEITFEDYQDGLLHNHLLGRTQIITNEIDLNNRITNPISPWYGREDSIGTLVHELLHAQGIKFPMPHSSFDAESSAQLATLEVLAAMVNNGNTLVLPALLDELSHMSMQAAKFTAIKDGRLEEFYKDQEEIFKGDPFALANVRKAARMWDEYDGSRDYSYILDAYNYKPMDAVYRCMRYHDEIYGVKLPINWVWDMVNSPSSYSVPGGFGVPTPPEPIPQRYGLPEAPKPLVIDDLHYFYDQADTLTEAL